MTMSGYGKWQQESFHMKSLEYACNLHEDVYPMNTPYASAKRLMCR